MTNDIKEESFEQVSGGSPEETKELIDFVQEMDPNFRNG